MNTIMWQSKKPTSAGFYLVYINGDYEAIKVFYGDWQKSQNPEWLYSGIDGHPVDELTDESRMWYGPIPEYSTCS